jgi:predicted ABC-type ATPase
MAMRAKPQPRCFITAGPNGAGKTTFSRKILTHEQGILHFVNADLIAAGLSPLHPELAARAAGRLLISELDRLTSTQTSFALESTLSGMTYVERVQRMKELGYSVEIIFLRLSSPELAIKRVAHRVKQGGHHVPADDVRRRFSRAWPNFERHYRPLADMWAVYENSGPIPVLQEHHPLTTSRKSPDGEQFLAPVHKAMKAAAKEARRVAKMHGTKIWVVKDGKIVGLDP